MGPYIADAPGTCQQPCTTFRDQWGNCVDGDCETWYDGCNTCRVEDNILTSCTEEACFTNNSIARFVFSVVYIISSFIPYRYWTTLFKSHSQSMN